MSSFNLIILIIDVIIIEFNLIILISSWRQKKKLPRYFPILELFVKDPIILLNKRLILIRLSFKQKMSSINEPSKMAFKG